MAKSQLLISTHPEPRVVKASTCEKNKCTKFPFLAFSEKCEESIDEGMDSRVRGCERYKWFPPVPFSRPLSVYLAERFLKSGEKDHTLCT